jgi:hypothetical protein
MVKVSPWGFERIGGGRGRIGGERGGVLVQLAACSSQRDGGGLSGSGAKLCISHGHA